MVKPKKIDLLQLSWHIAVKDSPGSQIQSTRCVLSLPHATEAGRAGREGRGRHCALHPTARHAATLAMPPGTAPLRSDPFRRALRPKVCIFCSLLPPVYQRKDENGRL